MILPVGGVVLEVGGVKMQTFNNHLDSLVRLISPATYNPPSVLNMMCLHLYTYNNYNDTVTLALKDHRMYYLHVLTERCLSYTVKPLYIGHPI